MYKPSTYLVVTYFPTYPPIYVTYFLILIQLRFIHNLSNNKHPVDGALVGAGSIK
jgi:hypothetical protein